MRENNSPIQLPVVRGVIESIAFGGKGILRHEGLVIFVPFACPGEEVEVEIVKKKKSFAEGRLLRVLKESEARTGPLCPYFGTCGGCQLQHLDYSAQLNAKQQMVVDAFSRIGKITLPEKPQIQSADPIWQYRRRVRWTLKEGKEGLHAGFISVDGVSLVENKVCPIFVRDTDTILDHVRQTVRKIKGNLPKSSWVSIVKSGIEGFIVAFDFRGKRPKHIIQVAEELLQNVQGVAIRCSKGVQHFGETTGWMTVDDKKFAFSPLSFVQAHSQQSSAIYEYIRDLAVRERWKRAIDLYCGIGVLSVLLSKEQIYARGVEINPDAIQLARRNAELHQASTALFECGDVEHFVPKWLNQSWEGIIVNPPRTGIDEKVLTSIAKGSVRDVVYVSCMPATLARDCARFTQYGYTVASVRIFDMFPQTTHLETVVHFQKKQD